MMHGLTEQVEGVRFNGESGNLDKSLYTVLNVCVPSVEDNDMLLFSLDINQISASGGSACSSGSSVGSHVLSAINHPSDHGAVRLSFGKFNTTEEIDYTVEKLGEIVTTKVS